MKTRTYISLTLSILLCALLAGCTGGSFIGGAGWNDPENYEDQEWSDPENYKDQDWRDPDDYEDQEWRDPSDPGGGTADPDGSEPAGGYRHEIDGIVFYTQYDVEQWIDRRQEAYYPQFDLNQMVIDIFGDEAWSESYAAWFPFYEFTPFFEMRNSDMTGSHHQMQAKDGYHPYIQIETVVIYDMGDGSEEYYKPYYFINGTYYCTDYQLIEIAAYACERWAAGEYYLFENFRGSDRLLIFEDVYERQAYLDSH